MPNLPIDNTAHLAHEDKQGWSGSFLLSFMVHALAFAVIVYFHQTPDMGTNSIQAQLMSSDAVADIEAQIRDSVATNGSSDGTTTDSLDNANDGETNDTSNANSAQLSASQSAQSGQRMDGSASILLQSDDANRIFTPAPDTVNSDSSVQKSDAMLAYEQRLLEKEAAYLAQQQAFAEQLDAEIAQEMREQRMSERQRLQEQQKTVNEYKRSEQNSDSITASNKEQLDAAKQANAARAAELAEQKNRSSGIVSLDDGQATVNPKNGGLSSNSSSRSRTASAGGSNNSNALAAIKAKIQGRFSPPVNTQGQRSVLVIKVARDGTVLDVTVSGSHSALNDAAKAAVYAASPLPIDPDNPKTYPTIRIGLTGTS